MASTVQIGGNGTLFVSEDKTFDVEVLNAPPPAGVPVDLTSIGATGVLDVRKSDTSTTVIFSKTMSIVGIYNPVRASNTQRWRGVLNNTELGSLLKAVTLRYSVKIESLPETVIARGNFVVEKATAP